MTNQITVDKLLEMRLSAMSDAFLIQLNDPQMQEVPFEDRFGMLVEDRCSRQKLVGYSNWVLQAGEQSMNVTEEKESDIGSGKGGQ